LATLFQLISLLEAFLLTKQKEKVEKKKGEKGRTRKPLDYNLAFIKFSRKWNADVQHQPS